MVRGCMLSDIDPCLVVVFMYWSITWLFVFRYWSLPGCISSGVGPYLVVCLQVMLLVCFLYSVIGPCLVVYFQVMVLVWLCVFR